MNSLLRHDNEFCNCTQEYTDNKFAQFVKIRSNDNLREYKILQYSQ